MTVLDPRFLRFAHLSGLDRWFSHAKLLKIQVSFLAALFAQRCGATFDKQPLLPEKQ